MVGYEGLINLRETSLSEVRETVYRICSDRSEELNQAIEFIDQERLRLQRDGWEKTYIKIMDEGVKYNCKILQYGDAMFRKGRYVVSYHPQISWKTAEGRDCWEQIYYIWRSESV